MFLADNVVVDQVDLVYSNFMNPRACLPQH